MQTYSTIPAVEDAPLATPAKSETPTRKRVAIIAAICFASAVAGTAAPAAARGVASFVTSSSSTYTCETRIDYVINMMGKGEAEACQYVALEYPDECGACVQDRDEVLSSTMLRSTGRSSE